MTDDQLKKAMNTITCAIRDLKNPRVLIGMDAIRHYLSRADGAPVSREFVVGMIRDGMPAVLVRGTWLAYTSNIDRFFEAGTSQPMPDPPDEGE